MKRNRKIEKALRQRFPGWSGIFFVDQDGWHIETNKNCKTEFYDLYPNLDKDAADKQIVKDTMEIINQFMPDATLTGYEQHGNYVSVIGNAM